MGTFLLFWQSCIDSTSMLFLAAISVSTCVTDFFIRLPVSTGGTNFLYVLFLTVTVIVLSWKKDAGVTSGLTVNESGSELLVG